VKSCAENHLVELWVRSRQRSEGQLNERNGARCGLRYVMLVFSRLLWCRRRVGPRLDCKEQRRVRAPLWGLCKLQVNRLLGSRKSLKAPLPLVPEARP
jgi:hypothetical protein